jgi:hypothetical protein
VLTRMGDERERPDFAGQRRRRVPVTKAAVASGLCRAAARLAGCAGARDAQGIALYWAAAHPSRRCTHTKGGAAACTALHRPRTQMGFNRAEGWAEAEADRIGSGLWLGPIR